MSATEPLALTQAEQALWDWAYKASGIDPRRVRTRTPRRIGEPRGPSPKVEISLLSLVPVTLNWESILPQVMRQRLTVLEGAGEVGVDFYPGYSFDPQRISVTAGAGDPAAATAQALLAELLAELPAPYTAQLDPSTVVLPLGGIEGTLVCRGSQVTIDSDGPGALPWTLVDDVVLPGDGEFRYANPGIKAAPAGSDWTIATPVPGWNDLGQNADDAMDAPSVEILADATAPLFATAPADRTLLEAADTVSRWTVLSVVECEIIWRVGWRASGVTGNRLAVSAASKGMVWRASLLDPAMRKLGFKPQGVAAMATSVPLDRDESISTLDLRYRGTMTGARTATPMRRAGATGTFSPV